MRTSKNTSNRKKVFLGLSGGVDSAVSAALLQQGGYDVVGVFIKVWTPDFAPCTWREERRDAMRVAANLGIPFLFFDFEEEYKRGVADYMIEEYKQGRTPNPDVMCNREIKFGAFWKKAKEMGADFIATGHYAQNHLTPSPSPRHEEKGISPFSLRLGEGSGMRSLREGEDKNKDQSYFLWTLTQDDLAHTLFPVGHLEKREVRRLAEKFDLPVADKKDSQGICFIGEVSMDEFLSHFVEAVQGNVLSADGSIIGTHKGAAYYTIGERHGFEVTKKSSEDRPYYVVSKDMRANAITVSSDQAEILEMSPRKIRISGENWIRKPDSQNITARIRYRGEKIPVSIDMTERTVEFAKPQKGLSPGQSIVFYDGGECLGGAIMDAILSE